ncbi:probable phospholipase A1 magnifin [Musca domestica]|uniref:Probable phospholipase A1 magnifin n=1 Tax=Musca domestica TaxID=7370 RepID=A0ABM3V2A4_MUSDO|nr:probable phospholipase A1 magnifin [Musca domestica]
MVFRVILPKINVQTRIFSLHISSNSPDTPFLLDPLNVTEDLLQPQSSLEILIHGFTLNKDKSPNAEIRPLLLQYTEADVISVDYEPLVTLPCLYPWAIENTRAVAKCLAELVRDFVQRGFYTPASIHIIGFSLGGQIAGLMANHLDFRIGKITGESSWE